MKSEEIVNKETQEVLTTKEGVPLVKNTLEVGDKFVCLWNKPVEEQKGDAKYPRYVMRANVLVDDKEVEAYIDLTPSQFNSLNNIVADKESEDLNQYKFKTYEYDNSQGGKSVGITHKEKKEPVSLLD